MEVLVGPTFNIEVPSSPDYVVPPPQDEHQVLVAPPSLFPEEEEAEGRSQKTLISRRIGSDFGTEDSSDGSSSIGAPDDSDEEEGDGVVSSSKAGLGSLDSLEDSLPIKRGLSNHFSGKSKSFGNLAEASSVGSAKDLEKPENPFNKRRRVLMANKWSRRKSSFYSWHNPKSMPLLALNEEDDDCDEDHQEEDNDDEEEDQESPALSSSSPPGREGVQQKLGIPPKAQGRKFRTASFKSQSCFSLADLELQHHQ